MERAFPLEMSKTTTYHHRSRSPATRAGGGGGACLRADGGPWTSYSLPGKTYIHPQPGQTKEEIRLAFPPLGETAEVSLTVKTKGKSRAERLKEINIKPNMENTCLKKSYSDKCHANQPKPGLCKPFLL